MSSPVVDAAEDQAKSNYFKAFWLRAPAMKMGAGEGISSRSRATPAFPARATEQSRALRCTALKMNK
ncbi:hypothetical protein NL676_018254 [Syzygium grande]|nr:hypothetical protein NL676_018254 [Syzygium grande]